jgi:hypothetical protein
MSGHSLHGRRKMTTRQRLKNRTRKQARWAAICGAVVFLFPLSLQHLDFRNMVAGGMSIAVHKSSPAFAALEDLREEYSNPVEELKSEPMHMIASGQSFNPRQFPQQSTQRVVALQGITIRARAGFQPKPFLVAGMSTAAAPEIVQPSNRAEQVHISGREPVLTDIHGDLLPLVERKRRLVEIYQDEDLAQQTVTEKAQDLIDQELSQPTANEIAHDYIPTSSGSHIYVAATKPGTPREHDAVGSPKFGSSLLKMLMPSHGNDKRPSLVATKRVSSTPVPDKSVMSLVSYDSESLRPLWLSGQLEMKEGLAFMGPETVLTVKRVFQGQSQEMGKITINEGKFEIRVKEAVGRLVAELTTRNGETIGRGEVDLLTVDSRAAIEDRIAGLKIPIHPTTDGTSIQVVSGYSNDNQKFPVVQAKVQIDAYTEPLPVNEEGRIFDRSLSRGSSFVARAESSKYLPTMIIGTSGMHSEAPLYTRTMLDALTNLTLDGSDRRQAMRQAIVWGRVSMDGKPVSGAQVELAGNYQPIYFNEVYVPDRTLTVTTQNGLFSYLMIPQGVHAVRVRYNGRTYPAQIFPATPETVSYIDLQLKERVSTQFQIYDLFNPRVPLGAQIRVVGVDEELPVNSGGFVEYPACANPFVVEADAGDEYELTRVMVNGTPDQVEIPTIKREWLSKLSAGRGINLIPQRGVIVGLVEDQAFEVELSGYGPNEPEDIVFFDPQGNPIDDKRGVAGGGFVVFNAPMGLQTIIIHPQYSHESLSQIVVAEPSFVHMVKFNFTR